MASWLKRRGQRHPDDLLDDEKQFAGPPKQNRVAACITAAYGEFCFRAPPSGKDRLRYSINGGWDITHVYLVVQRRSGRRKRIEFQVSRGI